MDLIFLEIKKGDVMRSRADIEERLQAWKDFEDRYTSWDNPQDGERKTMARRVIRELEWVLGLRNSEGDDPRSPLVEPA